MYVLTKFFGRKLYQEEFVSGNLYISSLGSFSKVLPERGLREAAMRGDQMAIKILANRMNSAQMDIFEGTVASLPPQKVSVLPDDLSKHVCSDAMIKAKGYDYCNILCFCKIDFEFSTIPGATILHWDEPDMKAFGDYAIIVRNPDELLKRIRVKIDELGYKCVCGPVNYHELTLNGKVTSRKNSITLRMDDLIEIENYTQKFNFDAFDKMDKYKHQNEWRIAINNGVKSEEAVRIPVGDLSDIVVPVKREDLASVLNNLFQTSKVETVRSGYYGNISRDEMRKQFYELGDNKGCLMVTIG